MTNRVICASVFFFFVVFVSLSLLVSTFFSTFSQLFLVFSYPNRAFGFINTLLLVTWFGLCVWFLIKTKYMNLRFEKRLTWLIGSGVLIGLIYRIYQVVDSSNIKIIDYSLSDKLSGVFLAHAGQILVFSGLYVGFILLPLLFGLLKLRFNVSPKWQDKLEFYKPKLHIILIMLFACSIQPYHQQNNPLLYVDLWIFYVAFALLIMMLYRNPKLFGFYEYANLLWVVIGISVFIVTSKTLAQADYNNVRSIFIIIGVMGWCGDWMLKTLKYTKEPNYASS